LHTRTLRLPSYALAVWLASGLAAAEPSALSPEVGYNGGQMETPRSLAMGDALRANSNSLEALYLNPANLATTRVYHVGAIAQIWPDARRQTYGGGAVDSILNKQRIAGGLAANYTIQDPEGVDRRVIDGRFALALPIADVFFVGAAVKYLGISQDGPSLSVGLPPSAAAGGLSHKRILSEVSFDAGLTLKPIPELAFSVVGTNLTAPGNGFLPLTFGGGAGFGNDTFSIEVDTTFDFTTYGRAKARVMGGAELLVADSFPIRAGYRYDEAMDSHALSGGVGYLAPEFSVDAGVRANVQGPTALAVVLGFRYHLDGAGVVNADL
jgi:hypothetical protein